MLNLLNLDVFINGTETYLVARIRGKATNPFGETKFRSNISRSISAAVAIVQSRRFLTPENPVLESRNLELSGLGLRS